jgi:DNA mismatch repair protein MutS
LPSQSELSLAPINSALQKRLDTMLPDELSPKQALDLIYELKKLK